MEINPGEKEKVMLRYSRWMMVCAVAMAFNVAAQVRADDNLVDNPAYQSWAKFKPGTFVKYSTDSNAGGNATSIQMTQTLKDVDADKATIEVKMTMVMSGNTMDMPAQTHEIPAKFKKVDPNASGAADAPKTESSNEDVQAAGKTYSCKKTTITTNANGMTTTATTWTCDDIPGNVVKMESQSTGPMTMSTKMMLTDFQPQQ
jgi:hypothetical protein